MDLMALQAKIELDSKDYEQGMKQAEQTGKNTANKLGKSAGESEKKSEGFLKKIANGAVEQIGRRFSDAMMAIPGKVKDVFSQAMNLAGELEQNVGGAQAVFGNYFAEIQTVASNAYKNVGLSQSKYLQEANKMGSLLQGMGFSQSKSMEMTVDVMQRASDVASIMGIDVTAAMQAVEGAAKGNFTINNIVRSAA